MVRRWLKTYNTVPLTYWLPYKHTHHYFIFFDPPDVDSLHNSLCALHRFHSLFTCKSDLFTCLTCYLMSQNITTVNQCHNKNDCQLIVIMRLSLSVTIWLSPSVTKSNYMSSSVRNYNDCQRVSILLKAITTRTANSKAYNCWQNPIHVSFINITTL